MTFEIAFVIVVAFGVAGFLVWQRRPKRNPDLPAATSVLRIDPTPLVPHFEAIRGSLSRLEGRFPPLAPSVPTVPPPPAPPPTHEDIQLVHDAWDESLLEQHLQEEGHRDGSGKHIPTTPDTRIAAMRKRVKDKLEARRK